MDEIVSRIQDYPLRSSIADNTEKEGDCCLGARYRKVIERDLVPICVTAVVIVRECGVAILDGGTEIRLADRHLCKIGNAKYKPYVREPIAPGIEVQACLDVL